MSTPESHVLRACMTYLRLCGIACWRINVTGVPLAGQPGRFRKAPSKGIADILGIAERECDCEHLGCKDPLPLAVECKAPKGRQSPAQREFQQAWEGAGGLYVLARSVDELRNGLRDAGVETK